MPPCVRHHFGPSHLPAAGRHPPRHFVESLLLPLAHRRVAEQLLYETREHRRADIAIVEFRSDRPVGDQVGQQRRPHRDCILNKARKRIELVARHQRDAAQRELERHGSRGDKGRVGFPESLPFASAFRHDLRPVPPAGHCCGDPGLDMRDGRQDHAKPVPPALEHRDGVSERLDQTGHFALSRAGEQEERLFAICREILLARLQTGGRQHAWIGAQPMADKGAGRPPQPCQFGRLERQQAQYVIDMRFHRRRPARPPRPDARADIVDDRDGRSCGTHLPRDAQGEVRAVDGHQAIGPVGHDGPRGLANAPHQSRQIGHDRGQSHDGDFAGVEDRNQSLRHEVPAADTGQPHFPAGGRRERRHDVGAEYVA